MTKAFESNKIKKFSNIANKTVLIGSLIGAMITSPLCLATFNENIDIDNMASSFFNNQNNFENNCSSESFDIGTQYDCVTIKNTNINDMGFLSGLTIDTIVFENCDLRNCQMDLPSSITNVSFTNCNINNLNGLNNNLNICNLSINSSNVGGLDGIEKLENLESLTIAYVGIENIDNLTNLKNLKNLTLLQTCVKNIEPLRGTNIESLDISDSLNLTDIDPIKDMKNLKYLYSTNCQMCLNEDILSYINNSSINSNFTYEDLKIKNQVKSIAQNIFNDDMNDEEKISAAINYIVNNMKYDNNGITNLDLLREYNENALKYALQGIGCCRNYTAITTALLQEANINVYEILNDGHIWSLVNIESEYYWLDSTLIDLENYENVTDSNGYMTSDFENLGADNPCSVPETYYNESEQIEYKETNLYGDDTNNIQNTSKYKFLLDILSNLHIPFGALAGIAIAFNLGFKIKKKTNKHKIANIKEPKNNILETYDNNINDMLLEFDNKELKDSDVYKTQKYIKHYNNFINNFEDNEENNKIKK